MPVTVTGGLGQNPISLTYAPGSIAKELASEIAAAIDNAYSNTQATYYMPTTPIKGIAAGGYLVVPTSVAGNKIDGKGFGAIVDANNGVASTIVGGDYSGDPYDTQLVLAGDGGLKFTAHSGNVYLAAGGGNNMISFKHDTDSVLVATGGGNDTIIGGDGYTEIIPGLGDNRIFLGQGYSIVAVTGHDTISLGSGSDTIEVLKAGSAHVYGSHSSSSTLVFIGGRDASTVNGGAGSDTIFGAKGGGRFVGGKDGDNSIVGGAGAVTIVGGGSGDTLLGGGGDDLIKAALGNETLGGGGGHNVFDLKVGDHTSTLGGGYTITIKDFDGKDLLELGGAKADAYALSTFTVSGGDGSFLLEDGTKVILTGFTHLSSSNFKG